MATDGDTQAADVDSSHAMDNRPADSVAEVFDQLEQPPAATAATAETAELRQHSRHEWHVALQVTVIEPGGGAIREREIHVTTNDVSRGGFSFVAVSYIHPGTVVRAGFKALKGQPVLSGVVRSCVHAPGGKCRVGVEFEKKQ